MYVDVNPSHPPNQHQDDRPHQFWDTNREVLERKTDEAEGGSHGKDCQDRLVVQEHGVDLEELGASHVLPDVVVSAPVASDDAPQRPYEEEQHGSGVQRPERFKKRLHDVLSLGGA